ncbi:glutamate-5-semialdehyde dehydrogenase [Sphingobacterium sp. Mn56C]|uniref:glutamate-5-semialdehyde dehydrogenase n=1 Tax=Sphingobacterium sp. Mn56C TaxID=3395261 RepID=UPI003BE13DDF
MESIKQQLVQARAAKAALSQLKISQKQEILQELAAQLRAHIAEILAANQQDLNRMDRDDPKYDRLLLTADRIVGLAQSLESVALLPDPTGQLLLSRVLPNGLKVEKKTVALGVVGVIYESRPNVTIDVVALCLQSGNVCLLRGGSDAWYTNSFLVSLIHQVLNKFKVDKHVVQLLPTDRKFVQELLTAKAYVDILIPRGSQSLIDFVRTHATVPVIETGAGVCHTYVDETADLDVAANIVANAKISRPSVCNALDTVLVDNAVAAAFIEKLIPHFRAAEVEVFAAESCYPFFAEQHYPYLKKAQLSDFGREFLDLKCSIRTVSGLDEALAHIAEYSSKHSECIVSENEAHIGTFMHAVDAAAVYANASTRFTDGGEFGLGAEIGISTQKLHARGPFALEKLVTEKWFVSGNGQVRM